MHKNWQKQGYPAINRCIGDRMSAFTGIAAESSL